MTLLAKLADLGPAFRDAYFWHELRGTKGATIHNGRDEEEQCLAMDDLFEHVNVNSLNFEQWHVDVALTISISRLINNKAQFHLDHALQIKEFAGFRATTMHCAKELFAEGDQSQVDKRHGHYEQHILSLLGVNQPSVFSLVMCPFAPAYPKKRISLFTGVLLEWEVNEPLLEAPEGPKMIRTRVQKSRTSHNTKLDLAKIPFTETSWLESDV
ncbi:hypothetical protein BDR05DRAFT_944711 [Suillus weaverae]|nr:hypothetical protein BDR05DRAFT_944711 [Suillus weaverae]